VPEAGVVDQQFDRPATVPELVHQAISLGGIGEVAGDEVGVDAVIGGQLRRQASQPLLAPRHEGERIAAGGELRGDRRADSR
jgi:hypothetical protein